MATITLLFQAAAIFSTCVGRATAQRSGASEPNQMVVPGNHSQSPPANNSVFPIPDPSSPNLSKVEPNEFRLRRNLLQLQNSMVRPVMSPSDVVKVHFGLRLNTLVEVRNKEQLMTTDVWVEQVWQNPSLSWNKNDYGGLDRIYVKAEEIWVPDTVLYNNGNDRVLMAGYTNLFKTFVILYSNGTNRWMSPATFISTCSIDVKTFPFDKQTCDLQFGSWTMDTKDFVITPLHPNNNKADSLTDTGDWQIESFVVKEDKILHGCCSTRFSTIVYTLKISRKPVFYGLFLILPCIIIGGLILATFFLPPENGERLGLCSTILLAVSVYLLIVTELLPEKSDTLPLIGVYFIITMLEISFVLVATIFVLKAYHATSDPPKFLEIFALRFKEIKIKNLRETTKLHLSGAFTNKTYDVENPDANENKREDTTNSDLQEKDSPTTTTELQEINSPADLIARALQDEKNENLRRESWRDIAIAFDRLFFWVFTITFALSTFIVYSQT